MLSSMLGRFSKKQLVSPTFSKLAKGIKLKKLFVELAFIVLI
jgi:hypothetical protein